VSPDAIIGTSVFASSVPAVASSARSSTDLPSAAIDASSAALVFASAVCCRVIVPTVPSPPSPTSSESTLSSMPSFSAAAGVEAEGVQASVGYAGVEGADSTSRIAGRHAEAAEILCSSAALAAASPAAADVGGVVASVAVGAIEISSSPKVVSTISPLVAWPFSEGFWGVFGSDTLIFSELLGSIVSAFTGVARGFLGKIYNLVRGCIVGICIHIYISNGKMVFTPSDSHAMTANI